MTQQEAGRALGRGGPAKQDERETYALWQTLRKQWKAEKEKRKRRMAAKRPPALRSFGKDGRLRSKKDLAKYRELTQGLITRSAKHHALLAEAAAAFDQYQAGTRDQTAYGTAKRRNRKARLKPMTVDESLHKQAKRRTKAA